MKIKTTISWILRLGTALILLQTLFFKFTAAPESVYIFSELGMEPWGRIGVGIAELLVAIFLVIPSTAFLGALGGIAVISGAIFFHLTKLGIEVQNDGGLLFTLAIIVFVSSIIILVLHRKDLQIALIKLGIQSG